MTDTRSERPQTGRLTLKPDGLAAITVLMVLFGLFFGSIGPFDTIDAPIAMRMVYWLSTMVIGGLILKTSEVVLDRLWPIDHRVVRGLVITLMTTPVQTLVVMFAGVLIFPNTLGPALYFALLPAVWIISIVVVAVMELLRQSYTPKAVPAQKGEASSASGMPEALARHLPAQHRASTLIALQAEDHYVRVYSEAGSTLVLMRFSDAIAAAEAHFKGFRLHRSWWACESGLESVSFKRGSGEAQLKGDIVAPVSRTYAKTLKDAGWS